MALRSAAANNYLNRTGLSLSQTATTACGRAAIVGTNTGWQQFIELRGTGGPIAEIDYDEGAGQLVAYSSSNNTNIVAVPAVGTWFFWYIKLTGTGANQIEAGIWPDGGSLTTATLTLGNNNTVTEVRWGGNPFDDSNYRYADLKLFASVLTAAELEVQRARVLPVVSPYLWLPANRSVLADNAKDFSGAGRDLTVTGTPTLDDGPPVSWGAAPILVPYAVGSVTGAGAATLVITASGTGVHGVAGTGAATLGLTAAGSGVHGVVGTASATLAITASATGAHGSTLGTGAATLVLTASGTGKHGVAGTASATLAISASATGLVVPRGTGAATLTITGAGTGGVGRTMLTVTPITAYATRTVTPTAAPGVLMVTPTTRPTYVVTPTVQVS